MALNELRSADSAHAFAFASDYLGKRVTAGGRTVGRLTDLVAAREGLYPVVTGAVVRSADGERFLPVRHLATLGEGDIDPAALSDFRLGENQFLVRDVLLDKQIVDMEGAKVVRVNDVHMLFAQGKTYVVHVDVGLSGLLRRLGFEGARGGWRGSSAGR
ncbi:MAG: hypothetical protein M5R36_18040 [Deltaproteobacteria bacterium]|nr:hypothetical protein [Deltaproteobacteria bacterium]